MFEKLLLFAVLKRDRGRPPPPFSTELRDDMDRRFAVPRAPAEPPVKLTLAPGLTPRDREDCRLAIENCP